jgi:superfamily I DNA/RNA helicase
VPPAPAGILAAANGVIDLASERYSKSLWTERQSTERPQLVTVRDEADQARYVVERVLESRVDEYLSSPNQIRSDCEGPFRPHFPRV